MIDPARGSLYVGGSRAERHSKYITFWSGLKATVSSCGRTSGSASSLGVAADAHLGSVGPGVTALPRRQTSAALIAGWRPLGGEGSCRAKSGRTCGAFVKPVLDDSCSGMVIRWQ